jgi:hypothetical protein
MTGIRAKKTRFSMRKKKIFRLITLFKPDGDSDIL